MTKIYLTLPEAARRAGRDPRTMKRMLREGRFPGAEFVAVLNRWVIPETALHGILPYPGRRIRIAGVDYLPMAEFARRKGVTRQRISQLIHAGTIPVRRLDGRVFIAESQLDEKKE
jgi:hypothetical protein